MSAMFICEFDLTQRDTPPEWVRVAPFGHWVHPNFGPFEVTPQNAAEMVANKSLLGIDVVFDFEHQTLRNDKAPAGGWIKELAGRDDGLWARVEWTDEAREMIQARKYRYYSPVFDFDGEDPRTGKKIGAVLHSVGLTNTPLLAKDVQALAAKRGLGATQETDMDVKAIAKFIGLPEDATPEALKARLGVIGSKAVEFDKVKDRPQVACKAVLDALELGDDATEDDVTAKLVALKTPAGDGDDAAPTIVALKAQVDEMKAQLSEAHEKVVVIETERNSVKVEDLVACAIKEGKIAPSAKDSAIALATLDPVKFAKLVDCSPKLLPSQVAAPEGDDKLAVALTEEDREVADLFGTDPKEFAACKAALAQ